jgi:hypothetical protein
MAFASGQMILIPDQKLETCEAVRALLLRDEYDGYEVTSPVQDWDLALQKAFNAYVAQARNNLHVECLHLD